MEENQTCSNCKEPLKNGFFGANFLLDINQIAIINNANGSNVKEFCNRCGDSIFTQAMSKIGEEIKQRNNELRVLAQHIPVVTTHHPYNWEYITLGMVTAQSTTGTGVLSEITSSFTDLFGMQSGRYNTKLKNGELICVEQLRAQAIAIDGNAIIGTDIDYAEVGGDKGMIMVCMSGTAVRLKNIDVLSAKAVENISKVRSIVNRLEAITPSFKAFSR